MNGAGWWATSAPLAAGGGHHLRRREQGQGEGAPAQGRQHCGRHPGVRLRSAVLEHASRGTAATHILPAAREHAQAAVTGRQGSCLMGVPLCLAWQSDPVGGW